MEEEEEGGGEREDGEEGELQISLSGFVLVS